MKNILTFVLRALILITIISNDSYASNFIIKTDKNIDVKLLSDFKIKPSIQFFRNDNAITKNKNSSLSNELFLFSNYYNISDQRIVKIIEKQGYKVEIEKNYIYKIESSSNDPLINEQWALDAINANKAWENSSGEDIIIAIIDTGIDYLHDEFDGQFWVNSDEDINNNGKFDNWSNKIEFEGVKGDLDGIDNDNNGFADDIIGFDFVDQSLMNLGDWSGIDANPQDELGHGTKVSGIIAAKHNNKTGISGLAYNSKIMVLRAFDIQGNGEADDVANSIIYAAQNGAKIINMSFGEKYKSPIMLAAIKFAYSKGCVLIASAGNSNLFFPHYPSDYLEVMSVGNSTQNQRRSGNSNYGSFIDIVAPGDKILTTSMDNNDYTEASGTSFAAPYVSAAAALLLAKDSSLSNQSIKNILQVSAFDIGTPNWDIYHGAGQLDIGNALDNIYEGAFEIITPTHEEFINKDIIDSITVFGTIQTPLINNFEVLLGKGILPDKLSSKDSTTIAEKLNIEKKDIFKQDKELIKSMKWDKIDYNNSDFDRAYLNEEILKISTKELQDTIYTCRIKIYLKNNKVLEKRFVFEIFSNESNIKIENMTVNNAYFNDNNLVLISVLMNKKARLELQYTNPLNGEVFTQFNYDKSKLGHIFQIGEEIPAGIEIECKLYLINRKYENNDNIKEIIESKEFTFTRKASGIQKNSYKVKPYSFPMSYLMNDVFEKDGEKYVAFSDLSNLFIDSLLIYRFDDTTFNIYKNMNEVQIPMNFSDVTGDGQEELITTARKTAYIYKNTRSIFDDKIYETPISDYQWVEGTFDFDGDNTKEIIINNENQYSLLKYENEEFINFAECKLPFEYSSIRVRRGAIAGDFDNNGINDLIFGNSAGQIFIYEFINDKMELRYVDTNFRSEVNMTYLDKGDINSDGIEDFILMTNGNQSLFGKTTDNDNIWLIEVFNYIDYELIKIAEQKIWGVREGYIPSIQLSFRNGLNAGNIDNNSSDEIIVSVFPNLYVFNWNVITNKLEAKWFFPMTIANSSLIYDFDDNGVNEFGFTNFLTQQTNFYEFEELNSKPETPTNFSGYATGPNSALLAWEKVNDADKYLIGLVEGNIGNFIGSTESTQVEVPELENNKSYTFFLAAENSKKDTSDASNFLDLVDVYTHDLYKPIMAELTTNKRIKITFDGRLKNGIIQNYSAKLKIEDSRYIPNISIANGKYLFLNFNNNINPSSKITISKIKDIYNSPTIETTLSLKDKRGENEQGIFLTKLKVIKENLSISLEFSEEVDNSALDLANYKLFPYGIIQNIIFIDSKTVEIFLNQEVFTFGKGYNYVLSVSNILSKVDKNISTGIGRSLGFTISADNAFNSNVFPSPASIKEDEFMTFANLPTSADVEIYTLESDLLITLQERDGNGGVRWDFREGNGKFINPGVYIYRVVQIDDNGKNTKSDINKFMVTP